MHKFFGFPAGLTDGFEIAFLLDRKSFDWLAGFGDTIDDGFGPFRLDPDYHNGGDIWVGSGANDGAEMQIQIFTKLQAAIRMGYGHGALDIVGHGFACGVRDIIDGQDKNVVADTNASVFATPGCDGLI